jgi:hypothetical protein
MVRAWTTPYELLNARVVKNEKPKEVKRRQADQLSKNLKRNKPQFVFTIIAGTVVCR